MPFICVLSYMIQFRMALNNQPLPGIFISGQTEAENIIKENIIKYCKQIFTFIAQQQLRIY